MDSEELAASLGVSPRTVDTWRTAGDGPDYVKIGAQVRYRTIDVEEWLDTVRVIQGNTAGRDKPGPGFGDFVAKALQPSDASVDAHNLWLMWNEYLSTEPAAQRRSDNPELEADLVPALKPFIRIVPHPRRNLVGIRLTPYGQNLLTTFKQREWNLPNHVPAADLGRGLTGQQFAIGRRRADSPTDVVIDFARHPLLAIYGDGTGKTTAVRHLIRQITARRSGPEEAVIAVYDPLHNLSDVTQYLDAAGDKYENDPDSFSRILVNIETIVKGRQPEATASWSERSTPDWSGPIIYVIVDNADAETTAGFGPSLRALQRRLRHYDIGLRLIDTQSGRPAIDPLVRISAGIDPYTSPGQGNIIALGSHNDDLIGSGDFDLNLPPGAGYLTAADPADNGYIQLARLDTEESHTER